MRWEAVFVLLQTCLCNVVTYVTFDTGSNWAE